jgi:hypothetical protein
MFSTIGSKHTFRRVTADDTLATTAAAMAPSGAHLGRHEDSSADINADSADTTAPGHTKNSLIVYVNNNVFWVYEKPNKKF